MKLILLLSLLSFNVFAQDIVETGSMSVKSYSTENGYFELSGLTGTYTDDQDRRRSVKLLVNPYSDQMTAALILAKHSGFKVRVTFDNEDIEETEDCEGYSNSHTSKLKVDGEKYRVCYTISPEELVVL